VCAQSASAQLVLAHLISIYAKNTRPTSSFNNKLTIISSSFLGRVLITISRLYYYYSREACYCLFFLFIININVLNIALKHKISQICKSTLIKNTVKSALRTRRFVKLFISKRDLEKGKKHIK